MIPNNLNKQDKNIPKCKKVAVNQTLNPRPAEEVAIVEMRC